jgi:hypothetical protein
VDKVLAIFIVIYILAVKQAFPAGLENIECPTRSKECAEGLKVVFHELFDMDHAEFERDADKHLVMKFPAQQTLVYKRRHTIYPKDFFNWDGIKKVSGLVKDYFEKDGKIEERPYLSHCYVTWFTHNKFSSGMRKNLPKDVLDEPLDVKDIQVDHVFNNKGGFDYSLVSMQFKIPLSVGFYENAELSCEVADKKVDIVKIQDEFGDSLSILGLFKEKKPASN